MEEAGSLFHEHLDVVILGQKVAHEVGHSGSKKMTST